MFNRRLLVIEDDVRIANLICHLATKVGFTTHYATGRVAITKAYNNFLPDVIVLDVLMPDMDGIEVLQFLRQKFSAAHIVIMSGSDNSFRKMTESLGKGIGLIIDANISKPFRIAEVRAILEKIKESLGETKNLSRSE